MVRTALADDYLLNYLTNTAKQNACTVGLILGQTSFGKDYVIHFARTPPCQTEGSKSNSRTKVLKNINDINEIWVADHARHATRMLPGGMYVLGIFVTAQEDTLDAFLPKIKSILSQIHSQFASSKYLYGNPASSEKLMLYYSTKTQDYSAKSFDINSKTVAPVEFKFIPKATRWNQLECKYEMDQIYHVNSATDQEWSLKKHMSMILDNVNENLKNALFLYDGEIKDMDENLENITKKKKVPRLGKSGHQDNPDKPFQVSILQPYSLDKETAEKINRFEVTDSDGQIRILGQVACKLWLHPKVTIKMASEALTQDIMRSLATRLEMHWDSLTEEESSSEDMNSIHEPPRRVLVALPNSKITLSDYLFPGEGPQDAQLSLQEMLDIKIGNKEDIQDIEGQADIAEFYSSEVGENESEETIQNFTSVANKFMYMLGAIVAIIALFVSIFGHEFIQI